MRSYWDTRFGSCSLFLIPAARSAHILEVICALIHLVIITAVIGYKKQFNGVVEHFGFINFLAES